MHHNEQDVECYSLPIKDYFVMNFKDSFYISCVIVVESLITV